MQIRKSKQLTWITYLLLGMGYFSVMSNWEINYFLKSLISLLPVQLGAAIYITYRRWHRPS
jgi:hypothetical protein